MNPPLKALPGYDCLFVAVRDYVEQVRPGVFDRLPYVSRVFAENLIRRNALGALPALLDQVLGGKAEIAFPFYPARVVLHDLLGTSALVDLAGLRDAVAEAGGDPIRVNPAVPTQLVVDHSLNVNVAGRAGDIMRRNMAIERRQNAERFAFLAWAQSAFANVGVVMHQSNVEQLSPLVQVADGIAFIDTLAGTGRQTTMINALGVVGWGVGGIEAESVMLGRPIWMRLPTIIGVELTGTRQPCVPTIDLVRALAEYLRAQRVVGAILEFHGAGVEALSYTDRAAIADSSPEFGATASIFAIDGQTLDYLRQTGSAPTQVELAFAYAKAQGLWAETLNDAEYQRRLRFDLGRVGCVCIAAGNEASGVDSSGKPQRLADLWPATRAVSPRFAWRDDSTSIRRPPYWKTALTILPQASAMRALAVLGDNVTTDDLSPSGAIPPASAAGRFLLAHGVGQPDFNSYASHRGDHRVAVRATLANDRLCNEMTPGVSGPVTRLQPEGCVMPLFDAAKKYVEREQELIVIAGKNYGGGSPCDWAAKGVRLLGVRVVVGESIERIHRTDLIGMGVLPVEFEAGTSRRTLGLDGSELYALEGWHGVPRPAARLTLAITRSDGRVTRTAVRCRIDTDDERETFTAGGLLPRIAREYLAAGLGRPTALQKIAS